MYVAWDDGLMVDCVVINYLLLGMVWFVIMMWTLLFGMPRCL